MSNDDWLKDNYPSISEEEHSLLMQSIRDNGPITKKKNQRQQTVYIDEYHPHISETMRFHKDLQIFKHYIEGPVVDRISEDYLRAELSEEKPVKSYELAMTDWETIERRVLDRLRLQIDGIVPRKEVQIVDKEVEIQRTFNPFAMPHIKKYRGK